MGNSNCASLSVSDSFYFEGVPPDIFREYCLEIEGRPEFIGEDLLEVKVVRKPQPQSPTTLAGASWHEVVRIQGGSHVVEIKKTLTNVSDDGNISLTIDVVDGPRFIPRFHGTYSITISSTDDGKSSTIFWTNAFVPSSILAYIPAIFFRRYLKRTMAQEELLVNQRLHGYILKKQLAAKAAEEGSDRHDASGRTEATQQSCEETMAE